jgi:hypothetical protein
MRTFLVIGLAGLLAACDMNTISMSNFEKRLYNDCLSNGDTEAACLCVSSRLDETLTDTEKKSLSEYFETEDPLFFLRGNSGDLFGDVWSVSVDCAFEALQVQ